MAGTIDFKAGTEVTYQGRIYTLLEDLVFPDDRAIGVATGPTGVVQPLFVWVDDEGTLIRAATRSDIWQPATASHPLTSA